MGPGVELTVVILERRVQPALESGLQSASGSPSRWLFKGSHSFGACIMTFDVQWAGVRVTGTQLAGQAPS